MKKATLFLLLVSNCMITFSQWSTTGNDIFNSNTGNVGIGTSTPLAKLTVNGNGIALTNSGNSVFLNGNVSSSNTGQFAIHANTSATDGAFIYLWNKDNTYSYKSGAIDLVSSGTSGHGVRFANYNPTTATWTDQMVLTKEGKLIIGTPSSWGNDGTTSPGDYKLYVERGILTEKVKVAIKTTTDWADYVFHKNYKLKTLPELDSFIHKNNHLPGIPSTPEAIANGVDLGKMTSKLLEKIEELTLYIIQINKENQALAEKVKQLTTPAQVSKKEDPSIINKEILQSLVKEIENLKREIETLKN